MLDTLRRGGIRDARVLEAMERVPRELFVPASQRSDAYADRALAIDCGQTISQPLIVAVVVQALEIKDGDRVLDVGTGSGYQSAVLAECVKEVDTIEIVPELGHQAEALLRRLGYRNIRFRIGDGYAGWPQNAPFDRIILTAAPPELPQAIVDQLKPGGRLLAPVGRTGFDQEIRLLEKAADGKVTTRSVLPVRFVPMVKRPAR